MRVMMLHADGSDAIELERVAGGEIVGMQIMSHQRRGNIEEPFEVFDALLKGSQGFVIFQIADVVAHESVAISCQAKGIFEMRAAGQHRFAKINS